MIQRSPNTFRVDTNSNDINVQDILSVFPGQAFISVRGGGATIVDLLNLSPTPQQKWTLQSIAIQAYMLIETEQGATGTGPIYGKLGKIVGGLLLPPTDNVSPSGNSSFPTDRPMRRLPADPSLIVDLWNPAVDPLPPIAAALSSPVTSQSAPSRMLPISGIIQLPQPLPLEPGVEIGVGIWIEPSLVGFANSYNTEVDFLIEVRRATYAIAYDNGQ